jgi:UDP-N-acetylglucosamine diphosphorylase/glucosamine-1-phosphate N-acetyltransferase
LEGFFIFTKTLIMNYILFDGTVRNQLLPFTYTRPVADIRVGILTIREKWEKYLGFTSTTVTEDYLAEKYPMIEMEHNIMLNASFLPNEELVDHIKRLSEKQAIFCDDEMIAFYTTADQETIVFEEYEVFEYTKDVVRISHTWDIFAKNEVAIEQDFSLLTKDRVSQQLSNTNQIIGKGAVFVEEGATVECAVLNTSNGSIYIGKEAEVMEGSLLRGPVAICDHATLKLGSKIYGATTIGPHSKVGGEVSNSVIFGYSNKGHDGFLGNSVLGEWCNIGADSNTSNLKNNYAEVRLWDYDKEGFAKTGLQFCGLMMGDHSKCGINTMFNTGTVVGVSANIFGGGFPRNFIPSFSWGGSSGFVSYLTKKAFEVAKVVMARRRVEFSLHDEAILSHVFQETKAYRKDD